jgi:hypothetical protein
VLRRVDPDQPWPCVPGAAGSGELGCIGDEVSSGALSLVPGQFTRQRVQGVHGAEHPQRAIDTGTLDQFRPSPVKLQRLIRGGLAHTPGGNIQAVLAPDGFPLWVSEVEPGSVHDLTAARAHALPALYQAAAVGLPTLADPGYDGAGLGIHIPVRQPPGAPELDIGARTRNALQRSLRCLGERGFALLSQHWRTLQHVTAGPSKIGDIARAGLVLTHFEYGHIT